jgi:soluble lytic murein transglycosylase-like protein
MRHQLGLLSVAAAAALVAIAYTGHERARAAGTSSPHGIVPALCVQRLPYEPLFRRAARATGIPESLLLAVAEHESRFDAEARSTASARGLMQVLPRTAAAFRLDAKQTDENVLAGALYLRKMLRRFRSLDLALAAYNAGPTVVAHLHRAPTVTVLTFVQDVTARWTALSACLGRSPRSAAAPATLARPGDTR